MLLMKLGKCQQVYASNWHKAFLTFNKWSRNDKLRYLMVDFGGEQRIRSKRPCSVGLGKSTVLKVLKCDNCWGSGKGLCTWKKYIAAQHWLQPPTVTEVTMRTLIWQFNSLENGQTRWQLWWQWQSTNIHINIWIISNKFILLYRITHTSLSALQTDYWIR